MASCSSAPHTAGSSPAAATPMAASDMPMPASTLCMAIRRVRRASTATSPRRPIWSTVRTASAASDDAVEPRAPMAIPTSARASAGASLIPSPVMITGARRCSRRTTSSLSAGVSSAITSSTPVSAPTALGCFRAVAGRQHDPADSALAQRPDGLPGIGAEPVLEQQHARRPAVDGGEHRQRAVQPGPAARGPDPRLGFRGARPPGAPQPDHAAADRARDALPRYLGHVGRLAQPAAALGRCPDDRGGQHVPGHLVQRRGEARISAWPGHRSRRG